MRFVDEEFLLLSRTGRFSRGTNGRLARARTREERIRQELALARERRREAAAPRMRAAYVRPRSWTAGVTGGLGRSRQYWSER